ncbi:glycosyltransferase family 2 protein [Klebsiella sp. RHBSTW-00484]|uniref:glycosyltransferase family 2 protein n=1 Tax=unclassified Klebsiella TaxID=2608929 RepID=UPI0015E4AA11|nr:MULTISPECIES: glycosyltransferase family 2 protein [unclassified Klebsiella]QLO36250.1 glycosyltransferase family 2 protein [Klebsiella sp. RHBSTW-00484]QLT75767.1 glycosyltransferase family 2 protein [Klebsiella sp. RHBSTW-00464]HDG7825907.1 glycosyltransferase family 2 protein [Klebsiella quasipneumoniae]
MDNLDIKPKKVDIICPIYNKKDYISSFLLHTRQLPVDKVNVIFVNDGSTDDSVSTIIDEINKFSLTNVYILNQKNRGVSAARNAGIKFSVSKYIWFCDPDDEIIDDVASGFIREFNQDVNLLAFSFIKKNIKKNKIEVFNKGNAIVSNYDFLLKYNNFKSIQYNDISTVWNKLFNRLFILQHGIFFDEEMGHSEDRCFNLDVLLHVDYIVYKDICLYQYNVYSEGTLSSSKNEKRLEDIIKANNKTLNILKKIKDTREEVKKHIFNTTREFMFLNKEPYMYYINEHKNHQIKIFPFISFREFLLFLIIYMRCGRLFNFIQNCLW